VFRIYTQATPLIALLIDTKARNHLAELNLQIQELNLGNGCPQERRDDFCIEIEWFEQIPPHCRGHPGVHTKPSDKDLPEITSVQDIMLWNGCVHFGDTAMGSPLSSGTQRHIRQLRQSIQRDVTDLNWLNTKISQLYLLGLLEIQFSPAKSRGF
jgi:hypothetical protein